MWLDKSHDSAQSNKRDKSQTGYACVLWRGDWMHKISKHIRNWKYQQHWLHGGRSQSNSRGATRQVNKPFICLEGKSMTFLFRSSQQFPRLRLAPLKGFLCWQSALQGPSTSLVRYFWNYRDTMILPLVRGAQDVIKSNWPKPWLCVCWETHLFALLQN